MYGLSPFAAILFFVSTVSACDPHGHGHEHRHGHRHVRPRGATATLATTYPAGSKPTGIPNAPAIPVAPSSANYPLLDKIPSVNSTEVQGWISNIDWTKVPNYSPTTDGSCSKSPGAAAQTERCWWTCNGCFRDSDISQCPDKLTWGVSFDDGPSPYTPTLLNFLNEQKITTTWFLVGSRVISDPATVVAEYMTGHQLSVHTWSHHALTSLTNEQIVAELGWAAKVIKDVVGVTPNTFRPPYGDIDDRVRAIAAQMGLTPIMWSGYNGAFFDTTDWGIASGKISVDNAVATFEQILNTYVPKLNSGFIVLEHDLYAQSVDVAIKYFLPLATQGKYALKSIIDCLHQPLANAYVETYSNSSSTTLTHTSTAIPSTSTSSFITSSSTTSTSGVAMTTSTSPKVESDAKSAAHHLGISFAVVVGTLASFFVH